jgi:hypothetical protein
MKRHPLKLHLDKRYSPLSLQFRSTLYLLLIILSLGFSRVGRCQASEGHSADLYVAPSTLIFLGYFTKNSVLAAKEDMDRHKDITTLRITSGGGDTNEAIELTDYVRSHNIGVVVDSYCMSACAHVLFAGALQHTVVAGGLVGFHGTPASTVEMLRARHAPIPADAVRATGRLRNAYARWGLNPVLLTAPFTMLGLSCFDVKGAAAEFRSRAAFWVPSREQLPSYGIIGSVGAWPVQVYDALPGMTSLAHDHPDLAGRHISFGGRPRNLSQELSTLPNCSPASANGVASN